MTGFPTRLLRRLRHNSTRREMLMVKPASAYFDMITTYFAEDLAD